MVISSFASSCVDPNALTDDAPADAAPDAAGVDGGGGEGDAGSGRRRRRQTVAFTCECEENYMGVACELCGPGHFGEPMVVGEYPCVLGVFLSPSILKTKAQRRALS